MQVFHVKKIEERPLSNLDMNIAADEDITSDKLRAHADRLYIVVVVALVAFYKQIVRLRSWNERQRTLAFFSVYSLAWLVDLLLPTWIFLVIILLTCPTARHICFPPAPASLISASTGALQKPLAGVLASDSLTGAPEKHIGEAVEQEARSFFNSISTVSISSSWSLSTAKWCDISSFSV